MPLLTDFWAQGTWAVTGENKSVKGLHFEGSPARLEDQTDSRAALSNVGRIASGSGRIV